MHSSNAISAISFILDQIDFFFNRLKTTTKDCIRHRLICVLNQNTIAMIEIIVCAN